MSTKDWKNGELKSLLSEAWGFSMDLSKLNEEKMPMKTDTEDADEDDDTTDKVPAFLDKGETKKKKTKGKQPPQLAAANKKKKGGKEEKEKVEENENVFAPNHYCVHHGGVERNGSIEMAEAVSHNYNKRLGKVTHYDMKFSDGFIMENVAFEDIQVTNASLAEGHGHPPGKRDKMDDDGPEDEMVVMQSAEEEGPDDPNALVDELGDLVDRLSAALGGAMDSMGDMEPDDMDDDTEMMEEEEEEELDERRARGRKGPHIRGAADPRLREAIKKALKASIVKKNK